MFSRSPDDVHSRLNREMWRMRLGGWRGFIGTIIVCLIVIVALVQIPTQTAFKIGEVTGVMAHMTEDGIKQQIGVVVDGQDRSAGTRAQLLHPATGEQVCLRETTYWPFDRMTFALTDQRFCE